MLFSEIYSSYYNVVAAILKEATRNKVIAPHNFIELVKKRLTKQQSCGL